jgi:hypothetical protein
MGAEQGVFISVSEDWTKRLRRGMGGGWVHGFARPAKRAECRGRPPFRPRGIGRGEANVRADRRRAQVFYVGTLQRPSGGIIVVRYVHRV